MLTEEAHHMFVGESGIARILERTCQLLRETGFSGDVRKAGGIDLPLIQKFVNFWFSQSLDLHGSEVSSNAAAYFSNGLKGRAEEDKFDDDHVLAGNMYVLDLMDDSGLIIREEVPMRNALNEVLRDWYVGDCQAGVDRWNKRVLEAHGMSERIALPSRKFNRKVGVYAGSHFDPWGNQPHDRGVGAPQVRVAARRRPTRRYLHSIQATPVYKPGQFANYIAPPQRGHQSPADRFRVRADRDLGSDPRGSPGVGSRHRTGAVAASDRRLTDSRPIVPIPDHDLHPHPLHRHRRRRRHHLQRSAGQHLLATR